MNTATSLGELFDRLERFVHALDACECIEGQVETVSGGFPPHLVACTRLKVHLDRVVRSKPEWLANDLRWRAAAMRHDLSHAISLRGQRGRPLTGKPSMRAACQVREAAKRMLDHRELLTEQRRPLTDGQRSLWCALDGKAMDSKELADALDTSPGTVRHWKGGLCRIGHAIEHRHGRGYYRPDAPPSDL